MAFTPKYKPFDLKRIKVRHKLKSRSMFRFHCMQCKRERLLPYPPNPNNFKNYARVALTAVMIALATQHWVKWMGLVSFFPIWIGFEVYYRWRLRSVIACSYCGFDPLLFLVNTGKARDEVEAYWREKYQAKGLKYPTGEKLVEAPVVQNSP